jgi:hypothetical protein
MSTLLEQASLIMIPSGYKEDVVYSVIPETGAGDLSFTRASNGTRINSAGLVEVCPWNFLEQSSAFNVSPWAFVGGTTLTSGITDINGTSNAFRYQATSGSYKYGYQTVSSTIGQVYTHSIYAKCSSGTQQFKLTDAQQGGGSLQTVTTEWQRFTFTLTASGGNLAIELGSDGTNALDIYICFSQTNIGSTAKPYFPTTDRLNVPRLTYQNGGGGCPSLLLEKQSTNINTYSEDFSNAVYSKENVTITTNQTTSPDGTQNADKLTDDGVNNFHIVYPNALSITASRVTTSVYVKNNDIQFGAIQLATSIGGTYDTRFTIVVDLINGTITDTEQVGTPNATYSIENVGNQWYRLNLTCDHTGGSVASVVAGSNSGTPSSFVAALPSYVGTGKSLFLWGMQIEASSYPTSYIPTTSASATRVADACFKTGISSLIGQTQGVVFCDFNYIATTNTSDTTPIRLLGSGSAGMYLEINSNNTFEVVVVNSVGTLVFNSTSSAQIAGRYKFAIAYNANDYAFYLNGTQIAVDTSGAFASASLDSLNLGMYQSGSQHLDGSINEAILFSTRLSNSELASLTSL